MAVEKTSAEVRQRIKQKSAYALPENPTERGVPYTFIKRAMYAPITDPRDSVQAELDRIVGEINATVGSVTSVPQVSIVFAQPNGAGEPYIAEPEAGTMYLVPRAGMLCDCYVWAGDRFSLWGTVGMNLDGYVRREEVPVAHWLSRAQFESLPRPLPENETYFIYG